MMEKETRAAPISYRPPTELREAFRARVEASGLPVNAFITQAVFDQDAPRQTRRAPIEQQTIARLLAETAREDAFCRYTIAADRPLLVPNAASDARFARNPLVTGAPAIRAYAGIPITAPDPQGGSRVAVGAVTDVFDEVQDTPAAAMRTIRIGSHGRANRPAIARPALICSIAADRSCKLLT